VANYKYHIYKGIAFGVSVFVVKRENRNFDSDFRCLLCNYYMCLWLKWRFRCDYLVISVVKGPVVSYTALCNMKLCNCILCSE